MTPTTGRGGRRNSSPLPLAGAAVVQEVGHRPYLQVVFGSTSSFNAFSIAVGPLLGAAFVPLAEQFGVSLNTFVSGVQGGTIAAIAVGSLVFNCIAVKYGKRPVYLITTIGMMVACFWGAAAKSFASLVASRVLIGLCMGPFEALVPASIGDVWFVHERGLRTAIFNLGVLGGINLATPIGKQ